MRNPIKRRLQTEGLKRLAETFLGKENFSWWAIFYASLIFIVTGWLPDGIAELLRGEWRESSYKLIISLTILFFIGYTLKKALKYERRIEVVSESPSKVKALAIFLSVLSMKKEIQEKEVEALSEAFSANTLSEATFKGKTWEMPIIAIKHHMPEIKYLYVFTSSGDNPSSGLMPIFTKVINTIFPGIKVEEFTKGGIDFEDVKEVFEKVEEFYQKVKKDGLVDKEVIIDITGGQKTNTIAGAMATLSFGRRFQYVSTMHKTVRYYDVGYFGEEEKSRNDDY